MTRAGHVGGQSVGMWGFYWGNRKGRGSTEALVLDRITALKRILNRM